ncbi:ABC transporter permease [Robertkochia solimangrovi]|uniref:ABC transporter permease n=1 Tax=Robertkochia solimangrovi TaxID=2213046 RepID=UPI00117F1F4A|nr:ABC transporter permease [Robertkochia solimangrovi]TRZ45725.1 ABC transporter permease [Robertkochia solimangrovi]
MIRNYFKIAWRNLRKNKIYSFINIFGLAIGMAVTIIIGLWVHDELNYNHYFKNRDKIAQVFQTQTFNGNKGTGSAIPRPLEMAMREQHSDKFKHIVMSSWNQPSYLEYKDINISKNGNSMQEGAIDMLGLKILKGVKDGISDRYSIMLSASTAKALFGDEEPIGKIIKANSQYDLKVTAVYEDIPVNNSFSDLDFVKPWDLYANSMDWVKRSIDSWGNNSFQLFVQMNDDQTLDDLNKQIERIKLDAPGAEDTKQYNPVMFLHPMDDWHLRSEFKNGVKTGGRIEYVWLFGIIGLFVLLLACINFMNLSTARSEKRAKEVGIRKSVGSSREQLIRQFLGESLFVVVIAWVLAIIIVLASLDGFNKLASKAIEFPWTNPSFWLASIAFVIITAVLSGSYPALYLSSFNPVEVLKGTFKAGKLAHLPRKVLVVTQFTVSIALIIGTIIILKQIQHTKNRPIGYSKEGLIQIPVMSQDFLGKQDIMRNAFLSSGAAIAMSTSSSPTTNVWSNRSGFLWEGKPDGFQEDLAWVEVSPEYVSSLGLKVVEGRDFSREFPTDSNAVLLNKTAVKYMGLNDPVGKLIRSDDDGEDEPMKVIGVVEDVIMQSPYEPVKQTIFVFDRHGNASYYNLRLNPDRSVSQNLETIEQVFKEHFPNLPFSYQFVDEEYAQKFAAEERIASLASVFTVLAILISCLGLFGLASFVAEQRTKEIGVRKVLGADITNLWMLLSKDFLTLVAISLLIASPLAYFFMQNWITKFTYKTNISWWIFLMAGMGAILITMITVSFQSLKAATANPVKSLRTE